MESEVEIWTNCFMCGKRLTKENLEEGYSSVFRCPVDGEFTVGVLQ